VGVFVCLFVRSDFFSDCSDRAIFALIALRGVTQVSSPPEVFGQGKSSSK